MCMSLEFVIEFEILLILTSFKNFRTLGICVRKVQWRITQPFSKSKLGICIIILNTLGLDAWVSICMITCVHLKIDMKYRLPSKGPGLGISVIYFNLIMSFINVCLQVPCLRK